MSLTRWVMVERYLRRKLVLVPFCTPQIQYGNVVSNSIFCRTTVRLFYSYKFIIIINKNRGLFQSNSEIHNLNTRFNHNLNLPSTNLTSLQKAVLYSGSKIYNYLPSNILVEYSMKMLTMASVAIRILNQIMSRLKC